MRRAAGRLPRPALERELLLRTITGSGPEAIAAYRAWRPSIDFTGPIDGETAALLPQLHGALTRLGLDDPLLGVFKGIGRRAWYENQTLLAGIQPVLETLRRKGIDFVLVGEIPLAHAGYQSLYLRRIAGADIVVNPADASEAARLIKDDGWQGGLLADEEVTYRHRRRFSGPAARVLTLRWRFIGAAATASADRFFWARTQPWNVLDASALRLSANAALVHLLLSDIPSPGAMPALWIADLLAAIEKSGVDKAGAGIDWPCIVSFAIEERLASRLRQRLGLLGDYGAVIPDASARRLREARSNLPEVIDRLLLRRLCGGAWRQSIGWTVLADYLRSDSRTGLPRGVTDFAHFARHRWELSGRRQILPAVARHFLRRA